MQKLAAVIAVAVFASGAASASDKTDAMAVVHKWVDSFNKPLRDNTNASRSRYSLGASEPIAGRGIDERMM